MSCSRISYHCICFTIIFGVQCCGQSTKMDIHVITPPICATPQISPTLYNQRYPTSLTMDGTQNNPFTTTNSPAIQRLILKISLGLGEWDTHTHTLSLSYLPNNGLLPDCEFSLPLCEQVTHSVIANKVRTWPSQEIARSAGAVALGTTKSKSTIKVSGQCNLGTPHRNPHCLSPSPNTLSHQVRFRFSLWPTEAVKNVSEYYNYLYCIALLCLDKLNGVHCTGTSG